MHYPNFMTYAISESHINSMGFILLLLLLNSKLLLLNSSETFNELSFFLIQEESAMPGYDPSFADFSTLC